MRFVTSLVFTACMAGEFATPFWPQHFVALASISSVGRAVGEWQQWVGPWQLDRSVQQVPFHVW